MVVVMLALLINLPLLQTTYNRWEVERSGSDVSATLVDDEVVGEDTLAYFLSYRLPEDVDPGQSVWPVRVDQAAYDDAVAGGQVTVRVLEGDPSRAVADGQVVGRAGLVATLALDGALLAILGLVWRFGRYGRPELLRIEAVGDVTGGLPGGAIVESSDGLLTVRGRVVEITDDDVVLDTGDRRVVVVLDGRRVLVDLHECGQVPGRRLV